MSDNSHLPPAGDQPHQAAPPQPPQKGQPYPAAAPAQPSQAYPGAAPSYGASPQQLGHPQQAYPQQGYPQQAYGAQPPAYSPPAPGYSAYGAPAYPVSRPSSGLAVTSLICGIAGIVLSWAIIPVLASIAAVVTGHLALRQTRANPALGGRGMAFAGLIMGYFVIAIMIMLLGVTLFSVLFFGAFTLPFFLSS